MQRKTNIVKIISDEGIQLRKTGKAYKARCPFHQDQHPSFYVYPHSNRFICYGCNERGDAIDFIRKLKNLTFKQTINYLGINHINEQKWCTRKSHKQKLVADFRQWVNAYYDQLTIEYRAINKVLATIHNIEEAGKCEFMYHQLPIIEYYMDILTRGSDEEKFQLYRGRRE